MKKLIYRIAIMCLLVLVWLIFTETLSWPMIIAGIFFSWLTVQAISWFQHDDHLFHPHYFSLKSMTIYFFYLVLQIYIAGYHMIRLIFSGHVNVDLVRIHTSLRSDLAISVLACSITLTPGTVTIAREGDHLDVLWIDCVSKDEQIAGPLVKKKLEDILIRPEKELYEEY